MRHHFILLFVLLLFILAWEVEPKTRVKGFSLKTLKRVVRKFEKKINRMKKELNKCKKIKKLCKKNQKEIERLKNSPIDTKNSRKRSERITQQFEELKKICIQNQKEISQLKNPPVAHLSTTKQHLGRYIVWDKQITPLDPNVFKLSEDGTKITIMKDGLYRFDFQGLSDFGKPYYPYFAVNGKPFVYGYGGSKFYAAANMNVIMKLKEKDIVTVQLQPASGPVHVHPNPVYHYLFIQKIA